MILNNGYQKNRYYQLPSFDSGVIAEPLLTFGGRHEHVDPKTGIELYGPYTLPSQTKPSLSSIIIGMVGPASLIADAEQWLNACKGMLTNDGSQPFLYPQFPGINAGHPFQCELIFGDTWRESFKSSDLEIALKTTDFYERLTKIIRLYVKCVDILASRDPLPHVILCCIPQEVVNHCTIRPKSGNPGFARTVRIESQSEQYSSGGQLFLFPEMGPTFGTEEEESGHQNLRRGLKAETMRFGIPTQIVWPRTLQIAKTVSTQSVQQSQDIATRAWNFSVALYHKAGGSPWRLSNVEPGVCFVGISFYKELLDANPRMRTSMAQAFTAAGDGYVLRGNSFEWNESKKGRSPHLDQKSASALMQDIIELYKQQNRGSLPNRVVVHKTSRFWKEEIDGLNSACQYIPRKDFVALGQRKIQFYRPGDYPPIRGSYIKFNEVDFLLYTVGYIPFLRTYPGGRIPQPIEIIEHYGDSLWNVILQELLALTKMNWNTADFACSEPITTAFSHRVGQILAELPTDLSPRPEYRFYM